MARGSMDMIADNSPTAQIEALPVYRNGHANKQLALTRAVFDSDNYDILIVAIPANESDASIAWKQTYRDQFSVPEGSFLIGIGSC